VIFWIPIQNSPFVRFVKCYLKSVIVNAVIATKEIHANAVYSIL